MTLDLSGFALSDGGTLVDLDAAITGASCNWAVGSVAELRLDLTDAGSRLQGHALLTLGTSLTWGASLWQVGSIDRTLAGWGMAVSVAARSELAKSLRLSATKTRSDKGVTPQSWITRRVTEAGGSAVVQAGSSKRTIVQKSGETVLDVITALASTMETGWVEVDGVLYVGTAWWAYEGGTGLPVWPVTWPSDPATDALSLSGTVSEDDRTQGASASLTLPYAMAESIRPWHRISLSGAGEPLDGLWLVGDVTLEIGTQSPVSLALTRPLQTTVKVGSAAKSKSSTPARSRPSSSMPDITSPSNPVRRTPARNPAKSPARTVTPPVSRGRTTYSGGTHFPYASGHRGGSNSGTALDVGMVNGTHLYACRSRYVISSRSGVRNHGSGGSPYDYPAAANFVLLGIQFNGQPAKLLYWHLSPTAVVHTGQRVSAGQLIGYSGNTGHSNSPHTHFQASWGHSSSGFGGSVIYPPDRVWA